MPSQSPLKAKPLRNPGDSVDEEIRRWTDDRAIEPLWFAGGFFLIAAMEWFGYLTHSPRRPLLFTAVALIAIGFAAWRVRVILGKVKQLKLGRDGERCVGQFLERLRDGGGQVLHDIPGEGFNLDHVVISPHGLYVVETKTVSKPSPKATITVEGDSLRSSRGPVWVLEPKMLPGFIEQEAATVEPADVALASYHLSRYVRAEIEKAQI